MKTLKRELLRDKRTARAYADLTEGFDVARAPIDARVRAGLSQVLVAKRMGTSQSVVARLESGLRPPSMRTVERFARAVGGRLIVRIEPARATSQRTQPCRCPCHSHAEAAQHRRILDIQAIRQAEFSLDGPEMWNYLEILRALKNAAFFGSLHEDQVRKYE